MAAAGDVQHVAWRGRICPPPRRRSRDTRRRGPHRCAPRAMAPAAPRGRGAHRFRPAPGGRTGCPVPGPCRRAGTPRRDDFHSASNSGRMLSIVALMRGTMWMPLLRIADGEGQHVGELPGAPVAQHQAPGIERAGHHGRQQAGRRESDRRRVARICPSVAACGATPWPQITCCVPVRALCMMIGASPPGPFRCGSATCRVNAGGDRGVERVAAALQHRHADLAGDPVRAGDDAERAGDLGAGGEHAAPPRCAGGEASGKVGASMRRTQCWCWWSGRAGAGKDTLLDAARQALADDPRFAFVRRVHHPAGRRRRRGA